MNNLQKNWMIFAFMGTIIAMRVVPHIANLVPLIALVIFATRVFSFGYAAVICISAVCLSDALLYAILPYPLGYWIAFTYSGLVLTLALGYYLRAQKNAPLFVLGVSCADLLYWTWTNFGVWLIGSMYPRDFAGMIACYVNALPFLTRSLLANITVALLLRYCERSCRSIYAEKSIQANKNQT